MNPRVVVHRPNKKRRKPATAEGRSSRQKMQEHNPHLQEHVVVLKSCSIQNRTNRTKILMKAKLKSWNIPIRASSKTRISMTTKSEKRGGQGRRRRRNCLTVYLHSYVELEKNCTIIIVSLNARFRFKNT